MFRKLHPTPVGVGPDLDSFKQQESTFVILNLFVLALLLLIHTVFASHWGNPSAALIAVLAAAFLAQAAELIWLLALRTPPGSGSIALLTWFSIGFNIAVALVLAEITNREDTQYFILMVMPVLVAAFRLALLPTLAVVALVDLINFFWVWSYARRGAAAAVGEYFEAGTVSLIYVIAGVLTWLLVDNLRQNQASLSQSLADLKSADEALVREAKLAAVGRLSSAIAHEIRNPVSAIVSALATANRANLAACDRAEMFEIAAKEAGRLEKLTTDFLAYARPREIQRAVCSVEDTLGYVADACRPRAGEKGVNLHTETLAQGSAEIDAGQVEQALVNMVMNAVEASAPGGTVTLRAAAGCNSTIRIDVEDAGDGIPPEIVARVFEPFFTTKPAGTGLGLAIALGIARAHGGNLVLSRNEPGRVCFSMTVLGAK
ncbi:MAG TPA: HAMP domain-containing sensor histidine kinase [Terriglobia bacterium]|nr:HAMP domain-containing sensor histidine kinase [Terriglobia bacterium]